MTMARRFNQSKRPINSVKHIVDIQGALAGATLVVNDLVHANDSPVIANTTEVETASNVNSIFLNVQSSVSSTSALANMYMFVYKNPGTNIAIAQVPQGNATGASDFKKQIFHTEMIMGEKNTTAIPRTVFKGVLSIPRHMRRMAPNDSIVIALYSPGVTWDFCIEAIYKEYR